MDESNDLFFSRHQVLRRSSCKAHGSNSIEYARVCHSFQVDKRSVFDSQLPLTMPAKTDGNPQSIGAKFSPTYFGANSVDCVREIETCKCSQEPTRGHSFQFSERPYRNRR